MHAVARSHPSTLETSEAADRFDRAMQRAVGAGLAIALITGVAASALGASIYPMWWWFSAAPFAVAIAAVAVLQCQAGRFLGPWRAVFAIGTSASAALAAIAAGDAVFDVGTAILAVVVMAVLGIGFLEEPLPALLLGGLVIVGDTVIPALVRPSAAPALLVQTGIQTLFLLTGLTGGFAARRITDREEAAHRELAAARVADRAARAARTERRELEREVHDTVLNTLAAIGQASLTDDDPNADDVRRRCAADAHFLRTLQATEPATAETGLHERLSRVVDMATADGFVVKLHSNQPVVPLPDHVTTALVRATREALRNAQQHSGAARADVRLSTSGAGGAESIIDGTVEVLIVDRGSGIAANSLDERLGVRRSLQERMADAGGRAQVEHRPGVGTTVSLMWPWP